jgi:glycosyltransferase involved in cell wall biosynthesis
MRIALVNEYFPPHAPGGAEWSVEALARALAGRGHGVVGEAMSCGLPVVASSRGSVPEILARIDAGFRRDRCVADIVAVHEDAVATRRRAARVPR